MTASFAWSEHSKNFPMRYVTIKTKWMKMTIDTCDPCWIPGMKWYKTFPMGYVTIKAEGMKMKTDTCDVS